MLERVLERSRSRSEIGQEPTPSELDQLWVHSVLMQGEARRCGPFVAHAETYGGLRVSIRSPSQYSFSFASVVLLNWKMVIVARSGLVLGQHLISAGFIFETPSR